MEAHRHRKRTKTADREDCPSKGGIEKRLYSPPAEVSFYQPCGNKFVDQATQEKPYRQERQYLNEIILKYDEKLSYQLLPPSVS